MAVIILVLVLVAGGSCSCGTEGGTPTPTPGATGTPTGEYVEYTDAAEGFAISYPQDWAVPPQDEWPERMVAVFEAASACGNFTSTCVVHTQPMPGEVDFPTWFQNALNLFAMQSGYTYVSHESTTVDGMDAFEHVYTSETGNGVLVQSRQLFANAGSTVWIASCGCDAGCWEQYEALFDTVAYSFHLLD